MRNLASKEAAQQPLVEVPQDPVELLLYMQDLQRDVSTIRNECREVGKTFAENQSKINSRRKMQFRTSLTGLELACLSYTSRVHQSRAKALEKKLALLGDKIEKIEKQSRERENLHLPSSNFLPAFYALPTELIRYIFVLCNAPPHPPRSEVRSEYFPPSTHIILSQVSTLFRRIVIGSPELWTRVKVDMSDRAAIQMLPTYLSRSGLKTLRLSIYAPTGTSLEHFWLAWNPVTLIMFRLGTLDLVFKENALLEKVLRYLRYHRAPRLTALTIFCTPSMPPPESNSLRLPCSCFIQHAPSLVSIDFRQVLPGMATWNSEVRRMHLHMSRRDLPITWLPIFASFSGVVALNLEDWHYAPSLPPFQHTITLPRLRYLKFGPRKSMRNTHIFLTMVKMTNLESLCIVWHSPMDIIQLFCELSGLGWQCPTFPLLRKLSFVCSAQLRIARQPDWEAVGPFNNLPFNQVEKLALVGFPANDVFLDVLFSPQLFKYPSVLPQLKTLSVCSFAEADHPRLCTLERIVATRWLVGHPLSRIEVTRPVLNPMWGLDVCVIDRVLWVSIDAQTFAKKISLECFPPLDRL